jgi:hypothetical protein
MNFQCNEGWLTLLCMLPPLLPETPDCPEVNIFIACKAAALHMISKGL